MIELTDVELSRLAKRLMGKYRLQVEDREDFYQEMLIGLWRASKKYDPSKGKSWIGYAHDTADRVYSNYFRYHPRIGVVWKRSANEGYYPASLEEIIHTPSQTVQYEVLEIQDFLRPLSLREKRIAILMLYGYSAIEIADCLGIGKHYIHHIIEVLRTKSSQFSSSLPTDTLQMKRVA